MSVTPEELVLRIERLEHDLSEVITNVSPSNPGHVHHDLADAMSFRAWMKISAPTFAVMVMGFTLLWNTQQATYEQSLETSRALGRLDGAVASLEKTTARFDDRLDRFDERLDRFDTRLAAFDQRLAGIDDRLGGIDQRLDSIDGTLGDLGVNVGRLAAAVEKLEARL